jgi:hypothetical protein
MNAHVAFGALYGHSRPTPKLQGTLYFINVKEAPSEPRIEFQDREVSSHGSQEQDSRNPVDRAGHAIYSRPQNKVPICAVNVPQI